MDDSLVVGCRESRRYRDAVLDSGARDQRTVAEQVPHRLTLEELADDIGSAFVRADVVEGKNVGMIQRGGRAGLLFEPAKPIGVSRERRRQYLDGDPPAKTAIVRKVDFAHATAAEQIQYLVWAEQCAGRQHHRWALV